MNPTSLGVATAMYLSKRSGGWTPSEESVEGMIILIAIVLVVRAVCKVIAFIKRRNMRKGEKDR